MALSNEQRRNAQTIIRVGQSLGASQRDILIALMTAMQESRLRNLRYGHLDSVGLFQQRNAWGSFAARTNPERSARMFFTGGSQGQPGLFDIHNRDRMSLTRAAQAVQRSAFPTAYAKHEKVARHLLGTGGNTQGFYRPVSGGRITQRFGAPAPRGITYARGFKNGMSFAAPAGSPVQAAGSGQVVRVASGGAYGNRVEIAHNGKIWTLYAHMANTFVRPGDRVSAGQTIGTVGSTGQTTGAHLHFELRTGTNEYNRAVDPQPYLNMNTTPSSYIRDFSFAETLTVPYEGEILEDDMMPVEADFMFRPYVYVDPLARFTEANEFMFEQDETLVPASDQDFSLDTESTGDTELGGLPEPQDEPREEMV
ncbi:MAG: M23 family metallopeptidase [Akkermansiaceae bacterium]|nr:M23 family metallopeptidase [Akkermansiaceae bacterium]